MWQILALSATLAAIAAFAVIRRRPWGRRLVLILLGAQMVGAAIALIVVAVVLVRDLPYVDSALSLLAFIFVPVVVVIIAVSLLAAWSIKRLEWPKSS